MLNPLPLYDIDQNINFHEKLRDASRLCCSVNFEKLIRTIQEVMEVINVILFDLLFCNKLRTIFNNTEIDYNMILI